MEYLPTDSLFSIALELDLPELLKWCSTSTSINNRICNRNNIWNWKLKQQFPKYDKSLKRNTPKETYSFLYKLNKIRETFDIQISLKDLFNIKYINRVYKDINEIPKEIEVLVNLESLEIYGSDINKIPKEIGKLVNLERLDLRKNNIREIPKEVSNLKKLKILLLSNNPIRELPKFINTLPSLTSVWVSKPITISEELNAKVIYQ